MKTTFFPSNALGLPDPSPYAVGKSPAKRGSLSGSAPDTDVTVRRSTLRP